MAEHNHKGRPYKDGEPRKGVTFRITRTAAEAIAKAAEDIGCSQSDIVEDYAIMIAERQVYGWPTPDWGGRKKKP